MSVSAGLGVTIPAGASLYRITSSTFLTATFALHRNVVNGQGAVRSRHGARFNYPGVCTVYLASSIAACFAEKMYYFNREVLTGLDQLHLNQVPMVRPFLQRFVLWDIVLSNSVPDVCELSVANAPSAGVFPCLLRNPSQDYAHLKEGRTAIQHAGYNGLITSSARDKAGGDVIVLFKDQSAHVASITPWQVEFRLLVPGAAPRTPFTRHATETLDYLAGEVRVLPPLPPAVMDPKLAPYSGWTVVEFYH